jgi:hypothetical protein
MIAFRRLSTGPTLPDLIRTAADSQVAAWGRTAPVAVGCRAPALMVLQGQNYPGLTWQSGPLAPTHVRSVARVILIQACFLGAGIVLAAAHLLLRADLLRSDDATTALRWSSRLTGTAMRLWRRGRLRARR